MKFTLPIALLTAYVAANSNADDVTGIFGYDE